MELDKYLGIKFLDLKKKTALDKLKELYDELDITIMEAGK